MAKVLWWPQSWRSATRSEKVELIAQRYQQDRTRSFWHTTKRWQWRRPKKDKDLLTQGSRNYQREESSSNWFHHSDLTTQITQSRRLSSSRQILELKLEAHSLRKIPWCFTFKTQLRSSMRHWHSSTQREKGETNCDQEEKKEEEDIWWPCRLRQIVKSSWYRW